MLGNLDKKQLKDLLTAQAIGRLGCHADGETYVVPINYVYRNEAIYAHSGPGKKINMMRANPKVCFQIDEIQDTFRWKSAILWGTYQELAGAERQQALQALIQNIMSKTDTATQTPSHGINPELYDSLIVYRINIDEGTGRYEAHDTPA